MKRTSLSKSFRTFGLMAMLSVLVATTLQQPVQAQSKGDKTLATNATACITLPANTFFNEFEGMTFSREQDKAYQKIRAARNKKYTAFSKTFREVEVPDVMSYAPKPGTSDQKMEEISNADLALLRAKVSVAQRRKLLAQRYGRYADFSIPKDLAPFTPEQIATGQKIWRDSEAQTMAILTPEQQKTYRAQLVVLRGLEACGKPSPFTPRMGSSYTTVDGIKREV
jgi:uncharacterized protein involved in tolerance to divalent cations